MREVLADLAAARERGERVALARVVAVTGSAPLPVGSSMLVTEDGRVAGSVSSGCIDADVYESARESLRTGVPRLCRYGPAGSPLAVGLTCGGTIEIFVEAVDTRPGSAFATVAGAVAEDRPVAMATVVARHDLPVGSQLVVGAALAAGSLGDDELDDVVRREAAALLTTGTSGVIRYAGAAVFVHAFAARPRMLVFGSGQHAVALSRMGGFLGYRVTVCDARPLFTTAARFPDADEVVVAWPRAYLRAEADAGRIGPTTVVCVLVHDERSDVPLLEVALSLPALAYLGAMGSQRTREHRVARLLGAGSSIEQVARIHSPIGLDLGSSTPEETAACVAAEILAERAGGSASESTHGVPGGQGDRLGPQDRQELNGQ